MHLYSVKIQDLPMSPQDLHVLLTGLSVAKLAIPSNNNLESLRYERTGIK